MVQPSAVEAVARGLKTLTSVQRRSCEGDRDLLPTTSTSVGNYEDNAFFQPGPVFIQQEAEMDKVCPPGRHQRSAALQQQHVNDNGSSSGPRNALKRIKKSTNQKHVIQNNSSIPICSAEGLLKTAMLKDESLQDDHSKQLLEATDVCADLLIQ